MSRVLSFRDLRLIPELSEFTEVEMLSISRDGLMLEALELLGFDTRAPILYVPSKHRDLQGVVAVGFRAIGEINNDAAYRNSRCCPLIERLLWAAKKDPSLARELAKMIGHSVNLDSDAIEEEFPDFPEEDIEPDFEMVVNQLAALTFLRDTLRGSPYNDQGNLKTPSEYQ